MKYLVTTILSLYCLSNIFSQSNNIDNTSKFKDGIYASYEDFINNDPRYPFESFQIKWNETPYFNKIEIKSCKSYKNGKIKKTDMRNIWGVCISGVPYIQYGVGVPYKLVFGNEAADTNGKSSFSRLRILGNLCHFNIEDRFPKKTDSRYMSRLFTKETSGRMIRAQRILKLTTGKVYIYDELVFSQLIKDDQILSAQFSQEEYQAQKLFLYLKKYNERNPIANRSIMANNK